MIQYNRDQRKVIDAAKYWYKYSSEQTFQFSGTAGTGKSVVLHAIISELGIDPQRVAPMAFTGAAALVMRLKGFPNAKTIHSWLYTPVDEVQKDNNGNDVMDTYFDRPKVELEFVPKSLDRDIDIIVIDEGSMVPMSIRKEIESRHKKVLVTGDAIGQLPPVGDVPGYLIGQDNIMYLTEIMRQAENSAIIYLSQRILHELPIHKGLYGDVYVIDEDEVTDQMLLASDIILCGKNITRDNINKYIRKDLYKIESTIPIHNEKVICRKNNWKIENDGISLANGLSGIVTNYPNVGNFDGKNFTIDFKPNLSNGIFKDIPCDYKYFTASPEQRTYLKNEKYNYGEKFELAYCITTHLSQGSQYANGMYFEEYLNKDINMNLNFTGLTRFSNSAIYVKHKRKYY